MVGGPGDVDALVTEYAWFRVDVELITYAGGPMSSALQPLPSVGSDQRKGVRDGGVADGFTI